MSDLKIKQTPKQILEEQRRQSCQQGYHQWRVTFAQGQFLCRVCGIVAYCPGCVPVYPHMHLRFCPQHREGEGGGTQG